MKTGKSIADLAREARPMRVDVYSVDCDGGGAFPEARGVSLKSCFPSFPNDPEYDATRDQLKRVGDTAFVGGGASQLFKIVRVGY